jgi:hypothetical protein
MQIVQKTRIHTFRLVAGLIALTQVMVAAQVQTVATGLDNPRGLAFGPDRGLYVAEAGRGGAGACGAGPEGTRCYGETGAITRIDLRTGAANRVVSGLPSLATDGQFATGVHDVAFLGLGDASITFGFGGHPADRQSHFGAAGANFARLAHVEPNGKWHFEADLGGFEAANNPTGDEIDSNPYGLLLLPGKVLVADAGANALVQVSANGGIKALAVFPNRMVAAPPFLGLTPGQSIPMDTVPTNVSLGPDGHYYVGQLTGFPFPVGGANVYRVAPAGGTPQVHASGFTAIIDIAFGPDGSLYVLEIAKNGLLAAFEMNDWTGALVRIAPDGARTELAAGQLTAPGGVAVGSDGAIYVTVNSIFSGSGAVVKITP